MTKSIALEAMILFYFGGRPCNSPISQKISPSGEQLDQRKLAHGL